ncbi:Transposon Ty3-I Gag-Pol polyprotein [Gossypium australe]|uniref:Transposon Ty3-I Gag-Pol polyprotein n=1 Tax=Gossypium australe TaxID=47621 RepID=A0A5B6UG69_9ROSI|nr:Transposon Ty3-I Gag-Pol polyprotein [Gossypium australe]
MVGQVSKPSYSFGFHLHQKLFKKFHSSPIGGHVGITSTFHRVSSIFFWKGMHHDVQRFDSKCQVCQ